MFFAPAIIPATKQFLPAARGRNPRRNFERRVEVSSVAFVEEPSFGCGLLLWMLAISVPILSC
jgi:hypothetical protein